MVDSAHRKPQNADIFFPPLSHPCVVSCFTVLDLEILRRALFESWWGREYALDLTSWDGRHLDGVFLVGGGAGDQTVVGSADAYRPRRRAGIPVSNAN